MWGSQSGKKLVKQHAVSMTMSLALLQKWTVDSVLKTCKNIRLGHRISYCGKLMFVGWSGKSQGIRVANAMKWSTQIA